MKFKLLLFLAVFTGIAAIAQFGPQQIVSTTANGAVRSIPFDMDADGFMDIVAASSSGGIVWHRNEDGLGTFSNEQIIGSPIGSEQMELFDLDGDGDMDVIYKTLYLRKIAWLENLDGLGNFGPEQLISNTSYAYRIAVADVDTDGDLDVLAMHYISGFDQRLVWYENIDGQGTFSGEIQIIIEDFSVTDLVAIDLDEDGDSDIVASTPSFGPTKLVWYENDGQGNFASEQIIYEFDFLLSDWTHIVNITPSDIDGDGKVDLLIDTTHGDFPDYIYWLENLNGLGSFSDPQFIHVKETSLGSLRAFDLDSDGDQDILVSFFFLNEFTSISWFENLNGQGEFSNKKVISTEVIRATDATAADLNSDGDIDVISASFADNKIAWYQNTGVIGISENKTNHFTLYPNPSKDLVTILSSDEIMQVEVFNTLGQLLFSQTNDIIDLSETQKGVYFIKIIGSNGSSDTFKIIKE